MVPSIEADTPVNLVLILPVRIVILFMKILRKNPFVHQQLQILSVNFTVTDLLSVSSLVYIFTCFGK